MESSFDAYKGYFLDKVNVFNFENIDNFTCSVVLTKNNTIIVIDRGWGGIPETLVINLFLATLLGICFSVVRCFAEDGPLQKSSWIDFIYGNRVRVDTNAKLVQRPDVKHLANSFGERLSSILPIHLEKCIARTHSSTNSEAISHLLVPSASASLAPGPSPGGSQKSSSSETINHEEILIEQDNARNSSDNLVQNETVFSIERPRASFLQRANSIYRLHNFLSQLFQLDEIYAKKGSDAYQYLLFQQYIIVLLTILSLICIFVLLPFNFEGGGDGKAFARTTIGNLTRESSFYWVHAISAAFIGLIGTYFMNYFSKVLKTDEDQMRRTALLIRRLPTIKSDVDMRGLLKDYFEKNFPEIHMQGLQFIYDYRKLDALQYELENMLDAKHYCERNNHNAPDGTGTYSLRPHCLGRLGVCCCCCGKVDGVDYYSQQVDTFKRDIHTELEHYTTSSPVAAIVTFQNEKMAMEVFAHFKEEQKKLSLLRDCLVSARAARPGAQFQLTRSLISYAPHPSDINWYNIGIDMRMLWVRKWLLNIILILIFIFLSTPAFLIKALDLIKDQAMISEGIGLIGATLADFLSPFLLMLMAIILPSIVTYVQGRIPYKTISALNHAIMSKVFVFLVFMILVLPSAGFVSINTFFWKGVMADKGFHWNCLFPVDNGAFFVIYTLQAAILGNIVELLRIPETSLYWLYSLILRSGAEYQKARRMITFEFPFGVSYARFLLIFTITLTYSQSCPLIAPAGLLYMFFKHFVDRYNIMNVYTPSKINWKTHSTAILYVHAALMFMLFQIFTVFLVKTAYSNVTIFAFIVMILFLLVFVFDCFYHWFRNINQFVDTATARSSLSRHRAFCICCYTPQVFTQIDNTPTDGPVTRPSSTSEVV